VQDRIREGEAGMAGDEGKTMKIVMNQ